MVKEEDVDKRRGGKTILKSGQECMQTKLYLKYEEELLVTINISLCVLLLFLGQTSSHDDK